MTDFVNPAADNGRRKLITAPSLHGEGVSLGSFLLVWVVSTLINIVLLLTLGGTFYTLGKLSAGERPPAPPELTQTAEVDPQRNELDLTQTDIGDDTNLGLAYPNDRLEDSSHPGKVDPESSIGVPDAPGTTPMSTPPPPGGGNIGTGAAPFDPSSSGLGAAFGDAGGFGSTYVPGGFGGRSASTKARSKLLAYGGGNKESEAAVALGLEWLAHHQNVKGHWRLGRFNQDARTAPLPGGRVKPDNCDPLTTRSNDTAGAAFGLLPFLAAGITHRTPPEKNQKDYRKAVGLAIKWLQDNQTKSGGNRGFYGGDMYSHALATIAMCEAYALSADASVKLSAQMAIDYLIAAQHNGGGWRYAARSPGDLSVTGWALMALRSGQMAGLKVPKARLKLVESFLDSVESSDKGGYGYMPGSPPSETMTSVGALCRQYLGAPRRNASLMASVKKIRQLPPAMTENIYYLYYATQVMHHMGEDDWKFWNLGPKGDGKGGIRDTLLARQDRGGVKQAQRGSFAGNDHVGGRLGATSLCLLTLEVYYRHLPLYREAAGMAGK
jgi:hypothetical protein